MTPASEPSSGPARRLALARLAWLLELGADEAGGEAPIDRYALPAEAPARRAAPAPARVPSPATLEGPSPLPAVPRPVAPAQAAAGPAAEAERLAAAAPDLAALAAAMEAFPCDLKAGARRFVMADGTPGAPLMVVGEAPGREEDIEGRPFVGPAGQLLDRMLLAIERDRRDPDPARAVYIANLLPWRPPGNRRPEAPEIARWAPFLRRHVALARPRALLLAGNTPCLALLGRAGITQMRGRWQEAAGLPAMPTFHPSYILHIPDAEAGRKREARAQVWEDLRAVRTRLEGAAS